MSQSRCSNCSHWEPDVEEDAGDLGICRFMVRTGKSIGSPATRADHSCEDWLATGFFKDPAGDVHADRRASARRSSDERACLHLPGGDRNGRLIDISERGARLQVTNPPIAGALALLKWGSHEVFCRIAWSGGDHCGVLFERPISLELVTRTSDAVSRRDGLAADPNKIPAGRKRARPGA